MRLVYGFIAQYNGGDSSIMAKGFALVPCRTFFFGFIGTTVSKSFLK
jgi:hypothetical protein